MQDELKQRWNRIKQTAVYVGPSFGPGHYFPFYDPNVAEAITATAQAALDELLPKLKAAGLLSDVVRSH